MTNLLELIKRYLYDICYGYKMPKYVTLNYINTFGYQAFNANRSTRKLWNNSPKMNPIAVNDVIEEGFVF